MFEIPQAKRVKRSRAFDRSSSVASSEVEGSISNGDESVHDSNDTAMVQKSKLNRDSHKNKTNSTTYDRDVGGVIDYGFEYDYIEMTQSSAVGDRGSAANNINTEAYRAEQAEDPEKDDPRDQTFQFHLFKPGTTGPVQRSSIDATTANKITIRSPTPESLRDTTTGSILRPRPLTHYFTSLAPADEQAKLQAQYKHIALSGQEIESLSRHAWPGTHLPWRVINIPSIHPRQKLAAAATINPQIKSSGEATRHLNSTISPPRKTSRTKPSKKRRIMIRQRLALRESQQAAASTAAAARDEAEREKRTRRNREKKVKRKEREKLKKLVAIASGGGSGGSIGTAAHQSQVPAMNNANADDDTQR